MAGVTLEGAINAAWAAYKRNAVSFIIAILLMMVVTGALVFIGVLPLIMMLTVVGSPTVMAAGPQAVVSQLGAQLTGMLFTLLFSLVFLTVAFVMACTLGGGLTAMTVEALKKKQTSYETMFSAGFARWKSFVGVSLLAALIVVLVCAVLVLPGLLLMAAGATLAGVAVFLIGILLLIGAVVFLEVAFSYVRLSVVVDKLPAVPAVKASLRFGRQNFWATLVLLLLFGALSFAAVMLNLFTYVLGSAIAYFVIVPLQLLSLAALYMGRKKGRR